MAESALKQHIMADMKTAMKGGDKPRLAVIRLIQAAMKQREVDERIELDDAQIMAIFDKMLKQRRDSIEQYAKAQRDDLVQQEQFEMDIIQAYLPEPLSDAELATLLEAAIAEAGAQSMRDMGKVMGILKPKLQGRADMGQVSSLIKQKLG